MKISGFILFLLLGTLTLSAQIERKPVPGLKTDTIKAETTVNENNRQSRKDRLKDLDLTKEQRSKLKQIREANKAAKDAIESNTQLSEQEKKKQLRELQKAQAQQVQAILTPEQREKFKASRQNNS